jgi:RNA polymerase sigma-70 factor, ECF subfamily
LRAIVPLTSKTTQIELLYRQHGSALLLFATAVIGNRTWAQDAVHQVFLRLIEGGDLTRATDTKAYLFACVRNAVLNEARFQDRNSSLDPSAWFELPERDYTAELDLTRALQALPDDQRQVIVLHVWGNLSFGEVAAVLDINANTAASRYRYALEKLREAMSAKEPT